MAKTGAKIGKRTKFEREIPADSGTYAQVAEVKSIGGPAMSRDSVEATHLVSDDDFAEFIAGIADAGEVSLVLNFRPEHVSQGSVSGLLADFNAGTERKWRVSFPQFVNEPSLTMPGFLTGWEPSVAVRDVITVAAKIKLTGKPTATNFA